MIGKCPIQKISEKGLTNNLNTIKSASPKSKSTPIQSQFARRRHTNQRSSTKEKRKQRKEKSKNSTQKRRVSAAVHKILHSQKEGEGVHHQPIIYRDELTNTPLDHSQPPEKRPFDFDLTFEFMDNFYKKDVCEMKQLPNIGGFKEICR
ncbi:hypothetical protein LXL04_033798 [Taraxacum kok-saghyz]